MRAGLGAEPACKNRQTISVQSKSQIKLLFFNLGREFREDLRGMLLVFKRVSLKKTEKHETRRVISMNLSHQMEHFLHPLDLSY